MAKYYVAFGGIYVLTFVIGAIVWWRLDVAVRRERREREHRRSSIA